MSLIGQRLKSFQFVSISLLLIAGLSGCDVSYWWSRGQPPSTKKLLERSETTLNAELQSSGKARADVAPLISEAQSSLRKLLSQIGEDQSVSGDTATALLPTLASLEQTFIKLEQNLYVGSRAPYAELSGQLRKMREKASNGDTLDFNSVGLFTARTYFFLGNELLMPSPSSSDQAPAV